MKRRRNEVEDELPPVTTSASTAKAPLPSSMAAAAAGLTPGFKRKQAGKKARKRGEMGGRERERGCREGR